MTDQPKPRVPSGTGPAGRALWHKLTAAFDFEPHELAMLKVAARQADDVAALEELIARDGMVVTGSQANPG